MPGYFAFAYFWPGILPATVGTDLVSALQAWLNASVPALAAVPGTFYAEGQTPGQTFPYGVLEADDPEPTFGTENAYDEVLPVRVIVYGLGRESARAPAKAVYDLLSPQAAGYTPLTFGDGIEYGRWPSGTPKATLDPDPGPQDQDVWAAEFTIRFFVQRSF